MITTPKAHLFSELAEFIRAYCNEHPGCTKDALAAAVAKRFGLARKRSVYHNDEFAIRFSIASGKSFSNVVLSLSTLQVYDDKPFIICIVRRSGPELLLANSTFLKKVSHSSHRLRLDNVKGSFLGHDVLRDVEGITNSSENFEKLFSLHSEFAWNENLARLVEATNNIAPTGVRFAPSEREIINILSTANLAYALSSNAEYTGIGETLADCVRKSSDEILAAGRIPNVNQRGNAIEQIITRTGNFHQAEDLTFALQIGTRVLVDVKTKILTLTSSPKGYNIDKLLIALAQGNTVFSFFFVGLELEVRRLSTRLVSILDNTILDATRIQFHWAGRNSRGVTQLTGDLGVIFEAGFREQVNVERASDFLQKLIAPSAPF